MKRNENNALGMESLDTSPYQVLAMTDGAGLPYCVPINGARVGNTLYFHSRLAGEKLDCLRRQPQVCLTAVGDQRVVQEEYETLFTSAVARGRAAEITDPAEKREALRAICRRYAPDAPDRVEEVIETHLARTSVWRVELETVSGRKKG